MNFLKKSKNFLGKRYLSFTAIFVVLFSISSIALAGPGTIDDIPTIPEIPEVPGTVSPLSLGTVYGFGWMGMGISNPDESQGGGGWLKFNCAPDEDCGGSGGWGMQVDLDSSSDTYGYFSGQAWSSNLGWFTADADLVSDCWEANPDETANDTMHVLFPSGKIVGWGKFVNGDDNTTDGYTGCVSFSGNDYASTLNMTTGKLEGWAWGSNVIGWVSLDCEFCDVTVVLENTVDILFWADEYTVPVDGGTTLNWSAINGNTTSVVSCPSYDNTSGYNHWESGNIFGTSSNVGSISVGAGNLPDGNHPINGIGQTTTYELTCKDSNGDYLPTKYLTINVGRVIGCMDPLASNYNPLATVPGRCLYNTPTVDLTMVTNMPPNFVPVGSSVPFEYQVSPRWTFTNPTQVGAEYCHGKFFDQNGTEQTLTSWTGADLGRPSATTLPPWFTGPYSFTNNVSAFAPGVTAGQQFTFRIDCTDINGNNFFDTAPVVFRRGNPPTRPNLTLDAQPTSFTVGQPNVGGQYLATSLTWTTNNESLIQPDSCSGTFSVNGTSASNLAGWTGARNNPDPSQSVSNVNLTSQASAASAGTFFRFTITCGIVGGGTVSANDTIIMTAPIGDPSSLTLTIPTPNSNPQSPSLDFEIITDGFSPVTLAWDGEEIDWNSCTGSSDQFYANGSPAGDNLFWDSASSYQSGAGNMQVNMIVPNNLSTYFTLNCDGNDNVPHQDTVLVCIDGADVYCPRSGGGFPGYEEF